MKIDADLYPIEEHKTGQFVKLPTRVHLTPVTVIAGFVDLNNVLGGQNQVPVRFPEVAGHYYFNPIKDNSVSIPKNPIYINPNSCVRYISLDELPTHVREEIGNRGHTSLNLGDPREIG